MQNDKVIFDPLKRSIDSLQMSLEQPVNAFIRDSIVKRFEYTYELSWKLIQKVLKNYYDINPEQVSRRDLFKIAAQKGIIDDVEQWLNFRDARNETSHAYSETVADEVSETARKFLPSARKLYNHLAENYK